MTKQKFEVAGMAYAGDGSPRPYKVCGDCGKRLTRGSLYMYKTHFEDGVRCSFCYRVYRFRRACESISRNIADFFVGLERRRYQRWFNKWK